ncbi:TolB protein [Paenibacillus phyllosphaerae]|uniref:TolB protein n=1 Tax=Paenibacillus phyllosphaerae TaxID=274593 RepID=A0A7W5AU08_9BACL|nr:PD40 domain-containing protein [Paenibacillus phyllosphaerae]MBB3108652.1 TolB protein [Paenibacillus phyllosphaerae]
MQQVERQQQNGLGLIAYTVYRGGAFHMEIYRPSDGWGAPLTRGLAERFSVPYWSANNRTIAFIGERNMLYTVHVLTGAAAQIEQLEPYTLLSWSPNSRVLAYAKDGFIVLYDRMAHKMRRIPYDGAYDVNWFPSGRELLFAAPDPEGNSQLYRMSSDGTSIQQLTNQAEGPIHNVRISPDGQFALYTSPGASISLITTVDIVTGATVQLEGGPLAKNANPAWSPDSKRIAYSTTIYEQETYSSLIELDAVSGGRRQTITASTCYSTPVTWSPNGSLLAFLSGCPASGDPADPTELWITGATPHHVPFRAVQGERITALQWSTS